MSKEALKLALELFDRQWQCKQLWSLEEAQDVADTIREALALVNEVDQEQPAQPQQEPVASIFISGIGEREFDDWGHGLPVGRNLLYTAPPTLSLAQRQSRSDVKPLTDDEIAELMEQTWGCASIAPRHAPAFARAIEDAHGIRGSNHDQ